MNKTVYGIALQHRKVVFDGPDYQHTPSPRGDIYARGHSASPEAVQQAARHMAGVTERLYSNTRAEDDET